MTGTIYYCYNQSVKKQFFLGVTNIIISILLTLILINSTYDFNSFPNKLAILITYFPHISILINICINIYLAFKLLIKRNLQLPTHITTLLTFYGLIWIVITFIAMDISYKPIFHFSLLTLTIITYLLIQKTSKKLAISMTIFSFFLSVLTIFNTIEESYCWHQGELADPTGQEMTIATKEDSQFLKVVNVNEGDKVGVSFKYHMLCHSSIDIADAISKEYSFFK